MANTARENDISLKMQHGHLYAVLYDLSGILRNRRAEARGREQGSGTNTERLWPGVRRLKDEEDMAITSVGHPDGSLQLTNSSFWDKK